MAVKTIGAGKKQNAKEEKSFKPVSSEYLYQLLTSGQFLSTFKSARENVKSTHREYGYHVFKDSASNQTQVTNLIEGEPDAIQFNYDEANRAIKRRFPDKNFFEFGTVHFHPLEKIANPSDCDTFSKFNHEMGQSKKERRFPTNINDRDSL